MKSNRLQDLFFLLLFMVLLAAGSACGRKTMVVPPQILVPEPIKDLRYSLSSNGVVLNWSYPHKLENGENLAAVESFRILRAEKKGDDSCKGCPLYFRPIIIQGGDLPGDGSKRTAHYAESTLHPGHRYFYKVQASADGHVFGPDSNMVDFLWKGPTP